MSNAGAFEAHGIHFGKKRANRARLLESDFLPESEKHNFESQKTGPYYFVEIVFDSTIFGQDRSVGCFGSLLITRGRRSIAIKLVTVEVPK